MIFLLSLKGGSQNIFSVIMRFRISCDLLPVGVTYIYNSYFTIIRASVQWLQCQHLKPESPAVQC